MGAITRWLRTVWVLWGSTRLAAILTAALLLAALLASLFPQMPTEPATQSPWLAAVAQRYGQSTGLLSALGLLGIDRSPWFLVLLAALLLNTLACTAQRLPRLWRICTEQGGWARAGTLVSHLAMVLLLALLIGRSTLSWHEGGVTLAPGQVYPVGHGQGFAVQAGPLAVDRHPDGQPKDYRVPLTILVDAAPLMTRTVRINHPLTFRGVTFYLQGYRTDEQSTVWQVSHDPTIALAIGLVGLFLIGIVVSLWLPQRRRSLRVEEQWAGLAVAEPIGTPVRPAEAQPRDSGGEADG
jgi:hypothetical protein